MSRPLAEVDESRSLEDVRILVVEDEPDTRAVVAMLLRDRGAAVLDFGTAEDALAAVCGFDPDLVLSDLSLPGVGGCELIRRLRRGGDATTPAIALSGNTSLEHAACALRSGFDAHVAKPVTASELLDAVRSMLERKTRGDEEGAARGK